jgi:hypothetical protein
LSLPSGDEEVHRATRAALSEYIAVAGWAGSDLPEEAIDSLVEDPRRRSVLLAEIARLAPRERGQVERLEISGRVVPGGETVTLSRATRNRINRAIDRTAAETVGTWVGDLREIDLDESSFVLRGVEPQGSLRCFFPDEMEDAAKDALDKRVRVTGSRPVKEGRKSSPLLVSRLEIVEEG